MRKWIALLMSIILLVEFSGTAMADEEYGIPDFLIDEDFDFESLDDPAFLQYLEDSIYADLESEFADNESVYQIEEVSVVFVSREYLEETEYNTRDNIFFGYNLAQINEVFQGSKYVFTLSDEGDTVVQEFLEFPKDTYDRVIKNVLIGAGVIIICVVISVVTAGAGAPAAAAGGTSVASLATAGTFTTAAKVHLIFTASAHTAASFAAKGAVFAGATTFITRGYETGWDLDEMTESALVDSSEAFKWGAISGAVTGGLKENFRIHRASRGPLSPREAEKAAHERYGGREQVAYLDREELKSRKSGAVVPDIVVGNEAIEVKCYDLTHAKNLRELKDILTTEIAQRMIHLPEGMTQRIVLNVEGRGYSTGFVEKVVSWIEGFMDPIYPGIPIDVMGGML